MAVSVVRSPVFQEHDPGPGHPECPERLAAIHRALQTSGLDLVDIEPREASREEVLLAHSEAHLARIEAARGQCFRFDADTVTSESSVEAAFLAAGSAVELAVKVAQGSVPPGMALVRPPGHHATRNEVMGFCLLNNVAIAALALQRRGLAERVAIYDWDVHHGNGTQDIFYEDPNVLYLSTHQSPFYPGTGDIDEVGTGPATRTSLNVPMPAGSTDQDLLRVTDEILAPRVEEFRPDIILISAGFDPFELDPLGQFRITVKCFGQLARRWRDLAKSLCDGRIAAVLEGGYHLDGLGASVCEVLRVFSGEDT